MGLAHLRSNCVCSSTPPVYGESVNVKGGLPLLMATGLANEPRHSGVLTNRISEWAGLVIVSGGCGSYPRMQENRRSSVLREVTLTGTSEVKVGGHIWSLRICSRFGV